MPPGLKWMSRTVGSAASVHRMVRAFVGPNHHMERGGDSNKCSVQAIIPFSESRVVGHDVALFRMAV